MPKAVRDKMVIIVGTDKKKGTFTKVKVAKRHKDIENFIDLTSLKTLSQSGDRTVPSIKTLTVEKQNFFEESSNSLDFQKDSRVQNIIERYLFFDDADPTIPNLKNWWETPDDSVKKI